jgi:hypothetical protein
MTSANGDERRPFRAVDVLSGSIDQRSREPKLPPARKQISAQLEPGQVRLLGELHARLNASATARIEKSDLVGLGIELLAALLEQGAGELDSAPDRRGADGLRTADDLRDYVRSYVREYVNGQTAGERGRSR